MISWDLYNENISLILTLPTFSGEDILLLFSFFQVLLSCLLHIIHKGRYIVSNYNSAFFRADHNASEMEAYSSALCQLRALLHLAQRLLNDNEYGQLYALQDGDLSSRFVQEYSSMHKACFYGRCLGFQVRQQTLNESLKLNKNIIL